MWSKILIISVVVGVCIAATVTVAKPPEEELVPAAVVDDLKTAESNVGRQFSHGGYGGNFGQVGGFGGYGGYGGSWGGHHSHGGYGGYGHQGYPHGGGYGHHHG
ncbi:uncharacterized protein LOC129577833 isoform X2 [Sitodiplosis mosellana]|uniref:uncharacterized protein LOC129577833 isoform X2 n=1 Tax=Sitodiplosis mosellana TaxID=263140 RepID=UPI002444F0C0|nr:uncharacterized protein LOC129577833 isoform X2 [Sitodiplosis mosellana]